MKFCNTCLKFKPQADGQKLLRGKITIWRCTACIDLRKDKA